MSIPAQPRSYALGEDLRLAAERVERLGTVFERTVDALLDTLRSDGLISAQQAPPAPQPAAHAVYLGRGVAALMGRRLAEAKP